MSAHPWKNLSCILAILVLAAAAGVPPCRATGIEHVGNDPFPTGWGYSSDLRQLVDLPTRVYWREVNGDIRFYYRGDTARLNEALFTFAALQSDLKQVVLRPGPDQAQQFNGKPVPYQWEVHVPGGASLATAREDPGRRGNLRQPAASDRPGGRTDRPEVNPGARGRPPAGTPRPGGALPGRDHAADRARSPGCPRRSARALQRRRVPRRGGL